MARKVGMVHTVAKLVPMFEELAEEVMPGTEIIHLVDEGLLKDIVAGGELTEDRVSRLAALASFAEASEAEAVMLTCSTVGPGVDTAKESVEVPFLKVDEAMADRAGSAWPAHRRHCDLAPSVPPVTGLRRAMERGVGAVGLEDEAELLDAQLSLGWAQGAVGRTPRGLVDGAEGSLRVLEPCATVY